MAPPNTPEMCLELSIGTLGPGTRAGASRVAGSQNLGLPSQIIFLFNIRRNPDDMTEVSDLLFCLN